MDGKWSLKITIEVTPELRELAYNTLAGWEARDGGRAQLREAIKAAENEIKPGDLVKGMYRTAIVYFIVNKIDDEICFSSDGFRSSKKECTKATLEEEQIIRSQLEGNITISDGSWSGLVRGALKITADE